MRENELLEYIYRANARLPASVTIPPGDDMAAVRVDAGDVLMAVDQLADGVHFDLASTALARVAHKAVARSVSDIAAMAGRPLACLATVALPRGYEQGPALYDALRDAAAAMACPLVGGDVAVWDHPMLITVTAIATPAPGIAPIRRDTARPGDRLYVTGRLGGSLESLAGQTHHLDFQPRVDLALTLAQKARPTAMIDLSDGLAQDLPRLCAASHVAAELDVAALPVSDAAVQRAQRTGQAAWQHALGDGEDYELLFAASADATVPAELDGVPITPIGRLLPPPGDDATPVTLIHADGRREPMAAGGWEHGGS